MATFAWAAGPLRASAKLPSVCSCSRARLSPQLRTRIPRSAPISSDGRAFTTSIICGWNFPALFSNVDADMIHWLVQEKKYTTEHEWIELSEDGKTGTTPWHSAPDLALNSSLFLRYYRCLSLRSQESGRCCLRRATNPRPRSQRRRLNWSS